METKEYRLTDICDFQGGTQPPKEEWINEPREGYVRMLQIRDFTQGKEEHVAYVKDTKKLNKCEEDDILIGRYGASVGKILTGLAGAYNVAIVKVIPNRELLSKRYLYFVLTGDDFQNFILNIGARAAQAGFNKGDLSLFKLHIPNSLDDQERIANVLEKTKNILERREKGIDLLAEFQKMKFLQMFYFNASRTSWDEVEIEKLADKKKGSMRTGPFGSNLLHDEFTEDGDVKVLGIDNVVKNRFDWQRSRCITFDKFNELKQYQVFPNDVLISIMGTLGRTAVVPENIPTTINSKHLAAITLDKEKADPFFVAYAFQVHPQILKQISNNTKGAIMDGLNLSIIRKIKIYHPPIDLQVTFKQYYGQIETIRSYYLQSLSNFKILYSALVQKALKGELEIIEKVFIEDAIRVEPKIGGEVSAIDKINKELEAFHNNLPHTGAPDEIDNTIRHLEAELKIKGEIPFWDEYVKYRIVKGKFKEAFTFDQLWQEISKFPFETLPEYDEVVTMLFRWLDEENSFIKQKFNETTKQLELIVDEIATA